MVFLAALVVAGLIIALWGFYSDYEKSHAIKQQNKENLENATRNWEMRVEELGIDTNTPVIWKPFDNAPEYKYAFHVWKDDSGKLCVFYAKPVPEICGFDDFQYPEQLRIMRWNPVRCYRTGTKGIRYETDYSEAKAKLELSKYQSGLAGLQTALDAKRAAQFAPTNRIEYDDRRTIIEFAEGDKMAFDINAYHTIKQLFPDIC